MEQPKRATTKRHKKLRVRQGADRAQYDQNAVNAVIDACLIGHVSFIQDGEPYSIPTAIARVGDAVYLHGSKSSRLFKHLAAGHPLCISASVLDGLVIAKSAFHCSLNYRSVVIFGHANVVPESEKSERLFELTERFIPLSREHYRAHLPKELKATLLLSVPLTAASAKIRTGGPVDDVADANLPIWSGHVPITQFPAAPISEPTDLTGVETPVELANLGIQAP